MEDNSVEEEKVPDKTKIKIPVKTMTFFLVLVLSLTGAVAISNFGAVFIKPESPYPHIIGSTGCQALYRFVCRFYFHYHRSLMTFFLV